MPSTLSKLRDALSPRLTEYIPHTPRPRQAAFLLLPHREALYGGAAGGGKTDALLMAALQYVDVPGYAALLLRRSFRQLALEESLLDRAEQWLGPTDARWKAMDMRWTFPSGATLSFGYLDREADRFQYQSAEFQFVGFDELTQWQTDVGYRYLFSRLRKKDTATMSEVPLRMRAGTNPGGLGHDWVKQRWHLGSEPSEGWLLPTVAASRCFLPAKLADNPYLEQDSYREGLAELDPVTRAQLEDGNWDARPAGSMLQRQWFKLVEQGPTGMTLCRYWDLAASEPTSAYPDPDWTAGALVGFHKETGTWWILDVIRRRLGSGDIDALMGQQAAIDRAAWGPVRVRVEQEPGASGKKVIEDLRARVFPGYDFAGAAPGADKVTRARPLAAAAQPGNVHVVVGAWTDPLLTELELFPTKGVHDDQVDAVTGAMAELAFGKRRGMRS